MMPTRGKRAAGSVAASSGGRAARAGNARAAELDRLSVRAEELGLADLTIGLLEGMLSPLGVGRIVLAEVREASATVATADDVRRLHQRVLFTLTLLVGVLERVLPEEAQ